MSYESIELNINLISLYQSNNIYYDEHHHLVDYNYNLFYYISLETLRNFLPFVKSNSFFFVPLVGIILINFKPPRLLNLIQTNM